MSAFVFSKISKEVSKMVLDGPFGLCTLCWEPLPFVLLYGRVYIILKLTVLECLIKLTYKAI